MLRERDRDLHYYDQMPLDMLAAMPGHWLEDLLRLDAERREIRARIKANPAYRNGKHGETCDG